GDHPDSGAAWRVRTGIRRGSELPGGCDRPAALFRGTRRGPARAVGGEEAHQQARADHSGAQDRCTAGHLCRQSAQFFPRRAYRRADVYGEFNSSVETWAPCGAGARGTVTERDDSREKLILIAAARKPDEDLAVHVLRKAGFDVAPCREIDKLTSEIER